MSLKFLPLRCGNAHHDAHHRFSGFGKAAKNYGEMVWLWDWLFGSLGGASKLAKHQSEK